MYKCIFCVLGEFETVLSGQIIQGKHETCGGETNFQQTGLKFCGRPPMSYLAPHIKQERFVQTKPNRSNGECHLSARITLSETLCTSKPEATHTRQDTKHQPKLRTDTLEAELKINYHN